FAHVEVRYRDRRRAIEPRVAMEIHALAPVDETDQQLDDLPEARGEVEIVAVGNGEAVEANPPLPVRLLERGEPHPLAREVAVVLEAHHRRHTLLVAEPGD